MPKQVNYYNKLCSGCYFINFFRGRHRWGCNNLVRI